MVGVTFNIPYHTIPNRCPHSLSEPHIQGISAGYSVPKQRKVSKSDEQKNVLPSLSITFHKILLLGTTYWQDHTPQPKIISPVEDYRFMRKGGDRISYPK